MDEVPTMTDEQFALIDLMNEAKGQHCYDCGAEVTQWCREIGHAVVTRFESSPVN